jgi:DNA-binding NtrC family response regulator
VRPDDYAHDEIAREKILTATNPRNGTEQDETVELRFDEESQELTGAGGNYGPVTIAVVDDDEVIRELVETVFSDKDWDIRPYEDGESFISELNSDDAFDLVFLDLMMPGINGFQVLKKMREMGKNPPVIIFSALTQRETVMKAVKFGVHSYMTKPLKPEKIIRKASEVLNATF